MVQILTMTTRIFYLQFNNQAFCFFYFRTFYQYILNFRSIILNYFNSAELKI